MDRITELQECIKQHTATYQMFFKNCELRQTEKYGCGVFAIRDIEPNEILFSDVPLILGPTGKSTDPIVCIMCYRKIKTEQNSKKFMCKNGCGLAICESIECAQKHKDECTLLKHWQPKNSSEISFKRTRALINIRSLFLNESQTKFLSLMQRNFTINKFEMYFVREFENFPSDIELATQLRSTSAAVNTNAIQILYRPSNSDDVHMRALYPIISLLNHHCVPNTRRNVDSEFKSNVSATRKIFKNEEIFTSYSQLLWGTNSRRMQLMVSKQFLCVCDRCVDQTEYGTNISAIKCKNKQCTGFVLPIMPIDFQSNAKCSECEQICDNKRYLQVQDIASAMVKNFLNTPEINLTKAIEFLETKLNLIVPDCNQFVIELKLEILWKCNSTEPKDLSIMCEFCKNILHNLDLLGAGECSLKGFIAHKLHTIQNKIKELQVVKNENVDLTNVKFNGTWNNNDLLWKTAMIILKDAAAAPLDILSA